MRVLFITPWYPTQDRPTYGVYVREYAKAASRFAEVAVLHLDGHRRPTRGPVAFEEEVVPDLTDGIRTYRTTWKVPPKPLPRLPIRLLAAVLAYRRISRSFRPDVIHAHVFSAGFVAALVGRAGRIPVVVTEHSSKFANDRLPWRTRVEARIAYRVAHTVLPVSEYLSGELRRWNMPGRFQVVPNVVDTTLFFPVPLTSERKGRLVFIGALRNYHGKGLPHLLTALAQLRKDGLAVRLDVLGDGPKRRELEETTVGINALHNVTFHGAVSKERVAEVLRNADVLVMPSHRVETFCCPVAEAQASGVPTVATTVGAIPEILKDGAGLLVPPNDHSALAEAISQALTTIQWDRDHIASGAEEFSAPVVGATLFDIYRRAVDDISG